jgi:voltage-gated potassium channel
MGRILAEVGLKQTLFNILEGTGRNRVAARTFRHFMIVLIIANILFAVIETVPAVARSEGNLLSAFQLASGFVFIVEYVLRIYVADLHPPLRRYGPVWARLRYAVQLEVIIDLIAALPLLLVFLLPTTAVTVIIVMRLLRFFKLARYSPAIRSLLQALASERQALLGSTLVIFGVILMGATLMFLIEHDDQPEKFASIPHAIWWAIATVTTVGYGDVVPVSDLGKFVAGFVMLMGYGLIALPVGIIASAFAREIHSRDFVVTWSMVARVPLFEDLKAAEIAEVTKLLRAQEVRMGGVIAEKGDVADKMYFISDGDVEIELPHETIYLSEGNFFGELALLHRRPRTATIRACHDCQLLVLEADALQALMDRKPDLAAKILREAEERVEAGLRARGDLAEAELAQAEVRKVLSRLEGQEPGFFDEEEAMDPDPQENEAQLEEDEPKES